MVQLTLTPGTLTLDQLRLVHQEQVELTLDEQSVPAIEKSAQVVTDILQQDRAVYGINTGFGLLATKRIADEDLKELQRKLVLSHSCGTGELLSDAQVRLIMVLKVNSLARGYSGIRLSVIQALITLINAQVYPCIPGKGSVGASGDLAPLAHMSAALLGVGDVRVDGELIPATEGLQRAGLKPVELGPKEGLALLNGTQVSTGLALAGLFAAEDLFHAALVTGSLSVDAALGSDAPFDLRIHAVRGHPGQQDVAAAFRELLAGSEIRASHHDCKRVHATLREQVAFYDEDRYFAPDIAAAKGMIVAGVIAAVVSDKVGLRQNRTP